nr:probable carboxypeptidase X1 [Lytechinus pictus]
MAKAGMYLFFLVFVACRTMKQGCTESNVGEVTTTEKVRTTTTLQPAAMTTSTGLARNPLGLESGVIPDSSFTASRENKANQPPWRGRLNLIADSNGAGAWVARATNADQWIQVE